MAADEQVRCFPSYLLRVGGPAAVLALRLRAVSSCNCRHCGSGLFLTPLLNGRFRQVFEKLSELSKVGRNGNYNACSPRRIPNQPGQDCIPGRLRERFVGRERRSQVVPSRRGVRMGAVFGNINYGRRSYPTVGQQRMTRDFPDEDA